jgi:HK97 family phage major capsid protein/HK97 family phage prohead protease
MTMTSRAYSVLEIKSADEADDKRTITGIASTPSPDRAGDIVKPEGAKFSLPIPLLWQHDARQPIGHVTEAKVTKSGIEIVATIAKGVSEEIDRAWNLIKGGLVRGLSIGFRGIDVEQIPNSWGVIFNEWEWLELSAVTIPANADATITAIKSIDTGIRAALGKADDAARPVSPGASGPSTKTVKLLKPKENPMATPIAEQISAFEATLAAKSAELESLMTETEGETLDAEKAEKADDLTAEIKAINDHLKRLNTVQSLKAVTAKPVQQVKNAEEGAAARQPGATVQVKRNVEKGIIFTRLLGAKYLAYKHHMNAVEIAKSKFGDTPEVETILKSAVAAGTTTDSVWASPLVELTNATSEFIELLRPATIIGRLNGLRRVPFNIKVPRGTQDPTAYWVGEASPKPVSSMAFDSIELAFNKVAGIVPMTEELMRFSNPAAEGLVRDGLVASIAYLTDRDFLDPTNAGESGVKPASVTYSVSPVTVTGTTADHFRADLGSLISKYLAANMSVAGLVLVMTSVQAMRLALMRNTLGQREFPDIMASGGTIEGIPVVTSENLVPTNNSPADGYPIVAINAPEVYLADDGGVDIDISREASLQMDSSPDSPTTASTVLVSLWQRNMVAIKAERFITWKKRQTGAVQYIGSAKYA